MILPLLSLALAVICFSIRELYYQGKLRWQDEKRPLSFWGDRSDLRKYKLTKAKFPQGGHATMPEQKAPDNLYYRLNDLKYKEKFPLSGTLLVWTTDCPHFFQFWFFNFLALSFTLTKEWDWYLFISLMIGIRVVHWIGRKLFSK